MPKIYTKTGDAGETGLLGGGRVPKDELRVDAYGTVDELNAAVGWARSQGRDPEIDRHLARVQEELFSVGAELATSHGAGARAAPPLGEGPARALEGAIDAWQAELPPLRSFLLPGGASPGAALHLARCVCRRAERRAVKLHRQAALDPQLLVYLNRLSDFLFVAARVANHRAGVTETLWAPGSKPGAGR